MVVAVVAVVAVVTVFHNILVVALMIPVGMAVVGAVGTEKRTRAVGMEVVGAVGTSVIVEV